MSMDNVDWRRTLYVGAVLSIVVIAIIIIFVILQVKNQPDMTHGGDWLLIGIQSFIATILFGLGYNSNKRESGMTRILLVVVGIVAILTGLLGLLAVSMESDINLFWKAIRICAISDIIIGITALYACI